MGISAYSQMVEWMSEKKVRQSIPKCVRSVHQLNLFVCNVDQIQRWFVLLFDFLLYVFPMDVI